MGPAEVVAIIITLIFVSNISTVNGFQVVSLIKTWWDAEFHCRSEYGTQLITITDSTMNTNIMNALSSANTTYTDMGMDWIA